ncbi:hypothetical protein [Pontibacter kalidii]|uniref:hypothetical protein n=1 Tax=Pontibacter kalidii TaxID=2592049 RepID=UPI002255A5B3|nr:hypothetical protein [Pontibacter kalidii]
MKNISRVAGQTSGVNQRFYYTLAANLPDEILVEGVTIVSDLQLAEGTLFNFFEATQFSPELDEPSDDDVHGHFYNNNFSGFVAGHTPELAEAMLMLKGKRVVVLYQDMDGQLKLIGDKEHPLVFECKYSSGNQPGQRKGYRFSFKGKSRNPAYFYSGPFNVAEEGTIAPPVVVGGEAVRMVDTRGNLIASIPAGKTIIIRSGFKLTYQIK